MTIHLPTLRIWTEVFHKAGDIYYQSIFNIFAAKNITTHFVIEQAVEVKSPRTLSLTEFPSSGTGQLLRLGRLKPG
ncbi:hypothetical protein N9154_01445 [Akkermansiaceae bacterium]|jgi:hypothetical protein|nr:hypothetical protein [Akkermansiaceae bacterium]